MSLRDVIKTLEGSDEVNLENDKYPHIKEILDGEFDVKKYSLKELKKSLITNARLNEDSTEIIKEIIWIIGGEKDLFNKYFEADDEETCEADFLAGSIFSSNFIKLKQNVKYVSKMYKFKDNLKHTADFIMKAEIIKLFGGNKFGSVELDIRFDIFNSYDIVVLNNLRLLKWAYYNKNAIIYWDADIFDIACEVSSSEMFKWLFHHIFEKLHKEKTHEFWDYANGMMNTISDYIEKALQVGNNDIAKFLIDQDYKKICDRLHVSDPYMTEYNIFIFLAENGYIRGLKFGHTLGYVFPKYIRRGVTHHAVIRWLIEIGY